jgi:hypothetical protein
VLARRHPRRCPQKKKPRRKKMMKGKKEEETNPLLLPAFLPPAQSLHPCRIDAVPVSVSVVLA